MPDKNDLIILDTLKHNAKWSTYKIAKKTLIPITTVHNRIKKLEKAGIIKQYTVILDHQKLGRGITAYVLVHYNVSVWGKETTKENFRKNLLLLPGVEEIKYITGEYDIMLKVRVKDMEELNNLLLTNLRKIPGIGQTNSIFVLEDVR